MTMPSTIAIQHSAIAIQHYTTLTHSCPTIEYSSITKYSSNSIAIFDPVFFSKNIFEPDLVNTVFFPN